MSKTHFSTLFVCSTVVTNRTAQGCRASAEVNNNTALLNNSNVILRAFLDDTVLLLRCCYVMSLLENTRIVHGIRDITTERPYVMVAWATIVIIHKIKAFLL